MTHGKLLFLIPIVALIGAPVAGQTAAVCGNAIREAGEQCDDGNLTNLDGCSSQCRFEQSQRINQLKIQFATDTVCTQNAFGGAFKSSAQSQLQTGLDASVKAGSTSIVFTMLGLDDLTGTNDPSVSVGILNVTPVAAPGITYDGNNDLDWWHNIDASDIDASRVPVQQLSGKFLLKRLSASGSGRLVFDLSGSPRPWHMSSLRLDSDSGASSPPTLAAVAAPPGHVAAEHLDPALTSYASSGASVSGELCGNVSASSLAAIPVPAALLSGGAGACTEGYTVNHSLLDAMVGGCHVLGGFIVAISPTQPDVNDASVPPAGAGPPYVLVETSHAVTSCKDKTGAVVNLTACLNGAAYSSFFKFSTDRVIAGGGACNMGAPQTSNNGPICAGQALQLTAVGTSGTYSWTGPNGFTSALQNPTISNVTGAAAGTYNVTVTVSGCTSAAGTTSVTVNPAPAMPAISATASLVAGASATASVASHAGSGYAWTITNGTLTGGQATNQITFTAGASGNVSLGVIETGGGCPSAQASTSIPIVGPPQNVIATASSVSTIVVSWLASAGAFSYEVARRDPGGTFNLILSTAGVSANDNTVSANTAYLYMVRAVDSLNNRSAYGNVDLATTVPFTDDPLVAQVTIVRASQLSELRTAVAAVQTLAARPPSTFTDPVLNATVTIKAVHLSELRMALDEARSTLALPPLVYTDPTLTPGTTPVKAAHARELRNGVR